MQESKPDAFDEFYLRKYGKEAPKEIPCPKCSAVPLLEPGKLCEKHSIPWTYTTKVIKISENGDKNTENYIYESKKEAEEFARRKYMVLSKTQQEFVIKIQKILYF